MVDLVAFGQPNDLLAISWPLLIRDHEPIRDQIIDVARTHRAGISEIAHLHRRGASREDAGARILREALEVDRNVDLEGAHELDDGLVALHTDVEETVERRQKPRPL